MSEDFFVLYDTLLAEVGNNAPVLSAVTGPWWSGVETEASMGLAMTVPGRSIAPLLAYGMEGLPLSEAAKAVKSWNYEEASLGMAAMNAALNTSERVRCLGAEADYDCYCTSGIDLRGKVVGLVGHLHPPEGALEDAEKVYILEREPQKGDYPDPACDLLLPCCDVVLITGSALTNKTLPHLLTLCRRAQVILTGPSVPLCPALLDFGIDRLAGMAVTDRQGMHEQIVSGRPGSPYSHGRSFLLKRE